MQFVAFLSTAAAMVGSASANTQLRDAMALNKACDQAQPYARIVNRCNYPVHLWSVYKGNGCPSTEMVTLQTGDTYNENYPLNDGSSVGVSIKMSKTDQCKGSDIVQLEYYLERSNPAYSNNYLDVSYVDCEGGDCPTRKEGYHLIAGNQTGAATASAGNTWCPVMSCNDANSCSKMSYVLPDDVQTKTCDIHSNLDFYMCGGEAPGQDYSAPSTPSKPSKPADKPADKPVSTPCTTDAYSAKPKPVVTNAPQVKDAAHGDGKTKVEVVYVTQFEYVNAKRHVHGHARRHQPFRA